MSPPPGFPNGAAREGNACLQSLFSTYPTGSPVREPSLQVPLTQLPQRETLHP